MTIAIAVVALAVSISTFIANWWRDKRDLLLKVHDRLTTPDSQRGRRLIYMREQGLQPEQMPAEEHELINGALAAFNTLGIYYHRRYVRRRDVMDLWAAALVRLMPAAEAFLAYRGAVPGGSTWPYMFSLAEDARDYVQRNGIEPPAIHQAFHPAVASHAPPAARQDGQGAPDVQWP